MAEFRGGGTGGERLPWLEPVEDEDDGGEPRGGAGRLIGIVLALMAIAGVVWSVVAWVRRDATPNDAGAIIRAPATPYKQRPASPGGMQIESMGAVAERTGVGGDIDSPLDLAALPEQPVTGPGSEEGRARPAPVPVAPAARPGATAAPSPKPAPVPEPKVEPAPRPQTAAGGPVRATPPEPVRAVVPTGGGGTVQLGAFSSEGKAKSVWKSLSGRFGSLAGLTMTVSPVLSGDKTLYRLRASGPGAGKVCASLRVAGESCTQVAS